MTDDWLTLPATNPDEAVIEALFDEVSSPDRKAVAPLDLPPKQGNLVAALRKLSPAQRVYMRAFLEGGVTRGGAQRVLREWNKSHMVPTSQTVSNWQRNEKYLAALSLLRSHYAEMAGLDKDSVLIKVGRVLDDALEPRPVFRDNSEGGQDVVTYTEEINGNVAMRALEFAGKVNRMIGGEDGTTRVTLNIVNIANRETPDVQQTVVSEQ